MAVSLAEGSGFKSTIFVPMAVHLPKEKTKYRGCLKELLKQQSDPRRSPTACPKGLDTPTPANCGGNTGFLQRGGVEQEWSAQHSAHGALSPARPRLRGSGRAVAARRRTPEAGGPRAPPAPLTSSAAKPGAQRQPPSREAARRNADSHPRQPPSGAPGRGRRRGRRVRGPATPTSGTRPRPPAARSSLPAAPGASPGATRRAQPGRPGPGPDSTPRTARSASSPGRGRREDSERRGALPLTAESPRGEPPGRRATPEPPRRAAAAPGPPRDPAPGRAAPLGGN
ncbi:translation initiation factor IF-2-like [Talpa occidentalis]|uniref:translation initiation factor IF-2-like n=1 Tax=Talpa occidentalis TaxID=50954 RepID=UPI0018905AB9|nr:translation initiation factor IF-2-like [Talpa occidentalis]